MVQDTCVSVLLGIDGLVVEAATGDEKLLTVQVVTDAQRRACCPGCGAISYSPKGYALTRPRDLAAGGRRVQSVWRKRRWYCGNSGCDRRTFTEALAQIPARSRLTGRLRDAGGRAVCDGGRTVTQAAHDHGLSWPTTHAAFVQAAGQTLPDEPAPTPALGIDETRRGRRRFTRDPDTGQLVLDIDCWFTGFADLTGAGGLLGQVAGRTAQAAGQWLDARGPAWRAQVKYVAIDMSSAYRAAAREWLPHATLVVDHFHVVQVRREVLCLREGCKDPPPGCRSSPVKLAAV